MKYFVLIVAVFLQTACYAQVSPAPGTYDSSRSFSMKTDQMIFREGKIDSHGNYGLGDRVFFGNAQCKIKMSKILCDSIVSYGADSNFYVYNVIIFSDNFPTLKGRVFSYNEKARKGTLEGNVSIEKDNGELVIGSYAELDFSGDRYKISKLK